MTLLASGSAALTLALLAPPALVAAPGDSGIETGPRAEMPLPELDAHVQELAPRLVAATVGISVDGKPFAGSGVIVESDGLVLSAAHVLYRTGSKLTFYLADGRQARGVALGMDHDLDIGLARIEEAGPWPYASLGYPKDLVVGDWCLATGHAGGIFTTRPPPLRIGKLLHINLDQEIGFGMGLVSSCTMISGDSGGPLFDLQGRVIGIHSTIGRGVRENHHATLQQAELQWEDFLGDVEVGESIVEDMLKPPSFGQSLVPQRRSPGQVQQMPEPGSPLAQAAIAATIAAWAEPTPEPEFQQCVVEAAASTVQVLCDGDRVALGTVVGEGGYIVTKASVLGEGVECVLAGGAILPAEVLQRHEGHDLALLKLAARNLVPVTWAADEPSLGAVLASPGADKVLSPGVVSVSANTIPIAMTSVHSPFGGPNSDQGIIELSKTAGEVSERRTNFPRAFTHDTVLWADDCGGPLVSADGKAVGINIARYSRTACYAIPAETVREVVATWLGTQPSAKPEPARPFRF